MTTASDQKETAATKPAGSAFAPFRYRAFAVLWIATVLSNIGTWMHDVGAGWLMTELAPSPLLVASVQAATTLPIFLFALLAGAIADIVDRRKLLIVINILMGIAAVAMTLLVMAGMMTAPLLLIFTFVMGTGAAFMAPAWQAIVPALVPKTELSPAIALNSMGINISRAIGPALAGFLIVSAGIAYPFLVNAISFLGIIATLAWWRPKADNTGSLPAEHVIGALRIGVRHAVNNMALRATLVRALAFFLFASALWAMLPLIARDVLSGGPSLYGNMLAAVGAGAVAGAFVLPSIKKRLGADRTVMAGTAGIALVLLFFALVPIQAVAVFLSLVAGISWIAVLSSLNVSAQLALPNWVRARGLSVFLTVFFGSMALGSLLWGQIATMYGIPVALVAAALGALVLVPLTRRAKLNQGESVDHTPSMHWPAPVVAADDAPDGPVMVQIRYRVAPENRDRFSDLVGQLASSRKRNGGYQWSLLQDSADPSIFTESWWESSWLDHQRHHERVTGEDQKLQMEIETLQIDGAKPVVTHLVRPSVTSTREAI
ncbi:MAG: MFS transporter [Pseudomonadota bacterium]